MRSHIVGLALLALGAALPDALAAQFAVARADVYLRAGQSRRAAPNATIAQGDTVVLLSSTPVAGYDRVRIRGGQEGWAYARYLRVISGASPPPPQPPPAAVDSAWARPQPDTRPFDRGPLGVCGPDGDGGDTLTNHRKNRIDEPALYHPVTLDALLALPFPANHLERRDAWPASDLAVIAPYEGAPVTVTAFVARQRGVIVEDSVNSVGGETTNCHARDDAGVDWHVTLVRHPDDPKSAGMVVESTPRVRAHGHPWTPDALLQAAAAGDSVRISGWLMYDPEHFLQTTNYDPHQPTPGPTVRATLWEIHPITRIEVFDSAGGRWRTLP
jgi:hypothetical protein